MSQTNKISVRSKRRREAEALRQLAAAAGVEPRHEAVGLLIAAALGLAMMGLVVWLLGFPATGANGHAYGVVEGFGVKETEYGTRTIARVLVDGRQVLVPLARGLTCKAGDRIELTRRVGPLGARYSASYLACQR